MRAVVRLTLRHREAGTIRAFVRLVLRHYDADTIRAAVRVILTQVLRYIKMNEQALHSQYLRSLGEQTALQHYNTTLQHYTTTLHHFQTTQRRYSSADI